MSVGLNTAAGIVVGRISALANQDAEFRLALACILDGLLDSKQDPENYQATAQEVSPPVVIDERPQTEPEDEIGVVPVEQPAAMPQAAIRAIRRLSREPLQTDLSAIEARCRLKAEGARWAVERQRLIKEGIPFRTAIDPRDRDSD